MKVASLLLLALLLSAVSRSPAAPPAAPLAAPDLVFEETGGLVAVEAEHFSKQDLTTVRAWHLFTPTARPGLTPDTDGTHVAGASGGAYLEVLPDTRWTHSEKLIDGENFSDEPGRIAVLSYPVHFNTPGRYYFWARVYSTGGEDNGLHVGLDGQWPESGRRWQTVKKNAWTWDSRQRTEEVHVGVPGQLFLDVPTAGEHVVQISMREDGCELDKWLMTTDRNYTPEGAGPASRARSGRLPAVFALPAAYREAPAPTPTAAKPAPTAAGAIPPPPGTILPALLQLEGTGFYLDRGKWAAVNPEQRKAAAVKFPSPAANGRYRVTLHAVGENDGKSSYEVLLGGRSLGPFTCPPSRQPYEEGPAFTHTWPDVACNEGDVVEVRARVASNDGKEYSRARWSRLVFSAIEADPGREQARLELAAAQKRTLARAVVRQPDGAGTIAITGELKQWHKVTLELAGPFAAENDTAPNPFSDCRFEVLFTPASGGAGYRVPGYFAADGRAAETSATAGTVWRAHLAPDQPGRWNYRVTFTHGPQAAVDGGGAPLAPFDGQTGAFTVAASDKHGRDFRGQGRLVQRGRYLQHAGTGAVFLKAGADAPETLLAYVDFDDTIALKKNVPLKTWSPHVGDWRAGDPTWQGGKGKGMIGALNYLAAKGANSFSFLTYNAAGDGDNVWPFVARDEKFHYDCSKLDQWGVVFDHATQQGLFLHFKLQENENDDHRAGPQRTPKIIPEALDGGRTGPERKLYLRELIARFGHALALNWNLGEENTQSTEEQIAMAGYIAATDPYHHLIVLHTFPNQQDSVYGALLPVPSALTGLSIQNSWNVTHERTVHWLQEAARAGRSWVVCNDEQNSAALGVPPDPGYRGFTGKNKAGQPIGYDLHSIRQATLWGDLLAGGGGVEYYFGYQLPENDLLCEDFRSRDRSWNYCRIAVDFFRAENIPVAAMINADELVGNPAHDNSRYCFAQAGTIYLVYLPKGGAAELDLTGTDGDFGLAWFNPREGGGLQPAAKVRGGAKAALTAPGPDDWLAVVRR